MRRSCRPISSRRPLMSSSASRRIDAISAFASASERFDAASASRSASSITFWARASMLLGVASPRSTCGTGLRPAKPSTSPAMPVSTGTMALLHKPRQTTFARRTLRSAFVRSDAVREAVVVTADRRGRVPGGRLSMLLDGVGWLAHRLDSLNVGSEVFLSCSRCYGRTAHETRAQVDQLGAIDRERSTRGRARDLGRVPAPGQERRQPAEGLRRLDPASRRARSRRVDAPVPLRRRARRRRPMRRARVRCPWRAAHS